MHFTSFANAFHIISSHTHNKTVVRRGSYPHRLLSIHFQCFIASKMWRSRNILSVMRLLIRAQRSTTQSQEAKGQWRLSYLPLITLMWTWLWLATECLLSMTRRVMPMFTKNFWDPKRLHTGNVVHNRKWSSKFLCEYCHHLQSFQQWASTEQHTLRSCCLRSWQ